MDEVGWSLLLIFIATVVSLFFSLNNIALRTFSRVKLFEKFKALNKEHLVDHFVDQVEDLVLTCAFLRQIANITIVLMLIALFKNHGAGYLLPLIIAIIIFYLFSLTIPHSWAKYMGESILTKTFPLLVMIKFIITPLLITFRFHDHLVKRLAGVVESTPEDQQEEKQEEILNLVEQGRLEGFVDEEEVDMIESVLELGETTAGEIMTPRTDIIALQVDEPLDKVIQTISQAGHSRIPVFEDTIDNIIGLVYAKDLLLEIGNHSENFNLRQKMREAYFVPETKLLKDLLHEFQSQNMHIAVVLDEYGGTAGIVTIEDILEELVGEIADEYEPAVRESITRIDQNTFDVDARTYIDDLNEECDIDLPEEEDFDTIGGFVFSHLGYIPKTGENFQYENIKFTIVAAEKRKILRIKIEKIPVKEDTQN